MSDIDVSQLTETTISSTTGRARKDNPYVKIVQHSYNEGTARSDGKWEGKAFEFTLTLDGKNDEDRNKSLKYHVNLLRRAGSHTEPTSTVVVHPGDIEKKTNTVPVSFRADQKIVRPRKNKVIDEHVPHDNQPEF